MVMAVGKRLVRWFAYSVFFAFVPFLATLSVRAMSRKLTPGDLHASVSEILFFSLMVGVVALADLDELTGAIPLDASLSALRAGLLFGVTVSAIFYGVFTFDAVNGTNPPGFRATLFATSIPIAVAMFLLSTLAQVLIARAKSAS